MTVCDGCIHDEICGCEGHRDEGATFCAHKENSLTTLLYKKMQNCMMPMFECSKCHGINTFYVNYCAWCGRKVVGVTAYLTYDDILDGLETSK